MNNLELGDGFSLEQAEKSLFAVYQTLYSGADVEQWYDWQARLNDTLGSEECYFLIRGEEKLGGAIIGAKGFVYPFLVAPFADRALFYRQIHRGVLMKSAGGAPEKTGAERRAVHAYDVLDADVEVLLTMGYQRTPFCRRVMIRPTDHFEDPLPAGFSVEIPTAAKAGEITELLNLAYAGGVHAAAYGAVSEEDVKGYLEKVEQTGTLNVSALVYETATNRLAAVCLAGLSPNAVNGFGAISELGVLPAYQKNRLGAFLVRRALTQAYAHAQALKLVVTIGNPAEALYRRLGFIPGPRFTRMKYTL